MCNTISMINNVIITFIAGIYGIVLSPIRNTP